MERTELKLFRISNNLTQEKFAKKLGYSRMHYARVENGQQEVPLKMLVALSKFSGKTIDEMRELTKVDSATAN